MTSRGEAHPLSSGVPPSWAVEWGEDRHGVFASFEVGEVLHRMRWVGAGRFVMGSPEGEAGRFDRRERSHEVTLTRGFWLGEVPCTQELWEAVTGENPSEFKGPHRPVAQLSLIHI